MPEEPHDANAAELTITRVFPVQIKRAASKCDELSKVVARQPRWLIRRSCRRSLGDTNGLTICSIGREKRVHT